MIRLVYVPPNGRPPVEWVDGDGPGPLFIRDDLDGLLGWPASALSRRGPGQVGVDFVDVATMQRMVQVPYELSTSTVDEMWSARELLGGSLATLPGWPPGVLMVHRDGREPLQTEAVPVESPTDVRWLSPTFQTGRVEFFCPTPLWRETSDRVVLLNPEPLSHLWEAEGFQGWEAPWEAGARSASADITNGGDVPVPFIARLYGSQVTGRLRLTMSSVVGEHMWDEWDLYEVGPDGQVSVTLEVQGSIAAGDYVEIDTGVNGRSVELVSNGSRETAIDRLNPNLTPLRAALVPTGPVHVTWEANEVNEGARAVLIWRAARSGI